MLIKVAGKGEFGVITHLSIWLNHLLLFVDQAMDFLTMLEVKMGEERIGMVTALFFTLWTFFGHFISTGRRTTRSKALAQALIRSSWVFPIVYIPSIKAPMWLALIFTIFISLGTWLILRKIAHEEYPQQRHRSLKHRDLESAGNEVT